MAEVPLWYVGHVACGNQEARVINVHRGVEPVGLRQPAAKDAYECGPTQNLKFT